ncbi:MAG: MFS transporter [Bdellovibrionaceae bacterium]|nr:MFS transporter [Pseudobdellovibrionaceae bacterium]
MKNLHWPYIIVAYLSLLSFGLLDNARGPFFPDIISDLNLRDDQASWYFALASIVAFFGSYLAPRILNYLGALNGLRWGLLLIGFGFMTMTFSLQFSQLLLSACVFGFGMGILQVFEHICIQEGSSPQIRRRLFNGLHSFYAAASLLAPLTAGWILSEGKNWRWGFKVFSILPLLALIYALVIKRIDRKIEKQKVERAKGKELWHMLFLSIILSLYVSAELSISTRLVLYVQRTTNLTPSQSTLYLTIFFAFLLLGRIIITIFDFKKMSSRQIIMYSLISSMIFYFLGLVYSPWLIAICGFFMAPIFGMSMDYIAHIFPDKSAQGFSISFTVGALLIVSMHYIVGLITQRFGIQQALYIGPIFLFFAVLLFLIESKIFASNSNPVEA